MAYFAIGLTLFCQAQSVKDSIAKTSPALTWGLYSQGFIPFSGVVLNHHTTLEASFSAPAKPVTFFLYKSLDTYDYTTGLNYITTGFLKTVPASEKLSFTVAGYYCISQMGSFWDSTSDAGLLVKSNWKISNRLSAELFAMAGNLTKKFLQKNLTNRAQLSYHVKNIDINLFAWYFAPLWHNKAYTAVSPQVTVNRVPVTKNIRLNTSLAWFNMIKKSQGCAIQNSVILSIKYPVNW